MTAHLRDAGAEEGELAGTCAGWHQARPGEHLYEDSSRGPGLPERDPQHTDRAGGRERRGPARGPAGDANNGLPRGGHEKFSESVVRRSDVIVDGLKGPLWLPRGKWTEEEDISGKQLRRGGGWAPVMGTRRRELVRS